MNASRLNRRVLGFFPVVAILTACGGAQSTGALPQAVAAQSKAHRPSSGKSWMRPGTSGQDLLYASGRFDYPHGSFGVAVFPYPNGSFVGQLSFQGPPVGLCSDRSGDVFIPVWSSSSKDNYIYEYAHGGTEPIATLTDSGVPFGCAVDPTTGNLAVTNAFGLGRGYPPGNVAIYADAQGTPTYYSDSYITIYAFCAYDDAGNLFVTGQREGDPIGELPEGSGSFENLSTNLRAYPGSLQWNSGNLVVAASSGLHGIQEVYRLSISGTYGTVVGKTTLHISSRHKYKRKILFGQFWVQGASIIGPNFLPGYRGLVPTSWHYPKGGKQVRNFAAQGFGMYGLGDAGITVSVAPSRGRHKH